jgi:GTP pyrophosphokinase
MHPHDPHASLSLLDRARQLAAPQLEPLPPAGDTGGDNIARQARQAQAEAVAHRLAGWNAPAELQAAGYLLTWGERLQLSESQIAAACDPQVARLCIQYEQLLLQPADTQGGHPLVRQRIRGFVAAYSASEVVFLYVAQLCQRLAASQGAPARQRRSAAEEAQWVLLPLLDMLGMHAVAAEVEAMLAQPAEDGRPTPGDSDRQLAAHLVPALASHLPEADISLLPAPPPGAAGTRPAAGRSPHTATIQLLVADEDACYQALRWIQALFVPIEGAIVDTLPAPRLNGYRSLQVGAVAALPSGRTRVQFVIVPRAQQEINDWGLAAVHLRGRRQEPTPGAWWNHAAAGAAQIALAAPGALPERLYVFTPDGELLPFDRGSTVVDFAYSVHSDLAEQCRRFLVNGRPVEPGAVLRHLDLVELEHDPRAPGPTRLWLQAAYTARARTAIERYLKRQGAGSHHGQKIIEERLKSLERHFGFNLPPEKVEQATLEAVRRHNFLSRDDLLAAIAAGQFAADRLFHRLFEREILRQVEVPRSLRLRPHQLHLAQCCRPKVGDEIVGRLYRRHGEIVDLTVHRQDCPRILDHPDRVAIKWRLQPTLATIARVDLRALDEAGLLGTVLEEVYARQPRLTLHQVRALARHGSARIQLDLHADQAATVQEVVEVLRRLDGYTITDVQSLNLPPSEQAEWQDLMSSAIFNPYSRLPVNEEAMFFGRRQESERIVDYLRTRQPSVWLIGQKRVGKTSLLLYLKEHYLPARSFTPAFVDFQLTGHPAQTNLFFQVASAVYADVTRHSRLGGLAMPLRSLFDEDPARQLIEYLQGVQTLLGARRLVLLMDEFSRLTDSYLQGELDGGFFDRWRAVLHTTLRAGVGYVVVMQQQTCDTLIQRLQAYPDDPSWRLMDVGQRLVLRPLQEDDVRRLIEWPMRNHLDYTSEIVEQIAELAGGSPFLIQAFCHNLVMHMARQQRQQVLPADVELVRQEFMQPQEHTFAHMTEMLKGISNHVAATLARLVENQGERRLAWAQIRAALPNVAADSLQTSLRTLVEQDILQQPEPEVWQFNSRLFQQWLAMNTY